MLQLRRLIPITGLLAACSACGDDGPVPPDGPPDNCAPEMTFTGEFIDWDSGTAGIGFLGIRDAVFAHRTDTAATVTTNPNGRFDVTCIPVADDFVDVTPAAASTYIGGTVVVRKDVVTLQPLQSYRSFKTTRAADFGFEPLLAHVYVHVAGPAGTSRKVSMDASPAVKKTFDGTAWVDGDSGTDVYFGNIPPGSGSAKLTVSGSVVGNGAIPLTAGAFTYITVVAY